MCSWQDNNATPQKIDWKKARDVGNDFVFIRAAYASREDEDFKYNWEGSKTIPFRGAYQFYDYRIDAKKQADYFVTLMAGDWGELPPVIDVEEPAWVYNNDTKKYERVPFPSSINWFNEIMEWLGDSRGGVWEEADNLHLAELYQVRAEDDEP